MAVNSPAPKIPARPKLPDKSRWDASSNPKALQKEKSLGETAKRFMPQPVPMGTGSANPLAANTTGGQALRSLAQGEYGDAFEKGLQVGGEYAGKAIGAYLGGNVGGKIGGEIGKRLMSGKKGKFIFFALLGGSCLNFLIVMTVLLLPLILLIVIIVGAVMLLIFGGPIALCVAVNQIGAVLRTFLEGIYNYLDAAPAQFNFIPLPIRIVFLTDFNNNITTATNNLQNIINNLAAGGPAAAQAALNQVTGFTVLLRNIIDSIPATVPIPNPLLIPPFINLPVGTSAVGQAIISTIRTYILEIEVRVRGARNLVDVAAQLVAICRQLPPAL